MKRSLLAFAAVAAMIFGFGSAGRGTTGVYPPIAPTVTTTTPSVTPGGTIVLDVTGCEPGATITATGGAAPASATAGADGSGTVSVTAPSAPGSVPISVSCGDGTTTININVLDSGPATNGGTNGGGTTGGGTTGAGGLPATGSDSTNTTLMLGLGALIVGGGLFGVSQIRRRQTLSA